MRVLPFFICGLVMVVLPAQSGGGHAQVLAWTVLFAALASTVDGAFRIVARDPDPEAGTRFVVLIAAALGFVAGCGHLQLWMTTTMQALVARLAATLWALVLSNIVAKAAAGGFAALAERLRAAGLLRPVLGFAGGALAGPWLATAPSLVVVLATLWGAGWVARVHGLDPDYVPSDGDDAAPADIPTGGEVAVRRPARAARAGRAVSSGAPGASGGEAGGGGAGAADARPAAMPVPRSPIAASGMPLAPGGVPSFAQETMPAIPACPLCAQPVLAHVVPCRECGASEHPTCGGARCSVCGGEKADWTPRAA